MLAISPIGKRKLKKTVSLLLGFLVVLSLPLFTTPIVHAQQSVPPGFQVTQLSSGLLDPKGITSPPNSILAAGCFDQLLYVAESGAGRIDRVDKAGLSTSVFAATGLFPVGVNFFGGFGGPFGGFLYVGDAFGGGIERVNCQGQVMPFALSGGQIAGLDLGQGLYGAFAYAGEWPVGNIFKVSPTGAASLFASVPGTQTRYLKFSQGDAFGTFLYYTDFSSGRIFRVDPFGNPTVLATVASNCLEGFEISPSSSAFGNFIYAGDVCNGNIWQVSPAGSATLWASGFAGVADIHFQPNLTGVVTMYLVDAAAGKVYAITPTLSVGLDSTSTSVSCSPSTVAVNQATQCTAFVTDTSLTPSTPDGRVTFSTSSSGSFSPTNTCTLTPISSSSSSCSVDYTPNRSTEGTQTIAGSYGGDTTHRPSPGYTTISVTKRSSSTSVGCSPSTTQGRHPVTCTATVTDTSPGTPITPTGTVAWSSSGPGSFSSASCTLSSTAACTVTYTPAPAKPSLQTITGTYTGDTNHSGSSGNTTINVL